MEEFDGNEGVVWRDLVGLETESAELIVVDDAGDFGAPTDVGIFLWRDGGFA